MARKAYHVGAIHPFDEQREAHSGPGPPPLAPADPGARPTAPPMHVLTLAFRGAMEREYRERHVTETLPAARAGLLLGLVLYAVFGVLDLWVAPGQRIALWLVRYALVCPVLLACFLFTFSPRFRRHRELTLAGAMTIAGGGVIGMTVIIPPPGSYLYYAGLLLVVMAYCTLLRLRFVTAAALAAAELGAYVAVDALVVRTPFVVLLNNVFFLAAAIVLGLSATYALEKHARHAFVQRRIIAARTEELLRKNEQLARANAELAQSREEVVRAARRTALVFAALTDALPGTVLDEKYRLEERIGSGSFGTVYRGTHVLLQQRVAVKVFRPRPGGDASDALERLRQEGVSACRLRHPNAVAVLDFGLAAESIAYLVMEFLEGRSLADEMRAVGPMSPARCAEILEPVCAVLAEAHAQGLVHRDIKPSNIFLHRGRVGEEVVKVIDFGIAKLLGDVDGPEVPGGTATGLLVGTPVYIAPERFEGGPYDGAVDMYAVGMTLYEMLCGRLPFETAANEWVQAVMRLVHQPLPLQPFDAAVPPSLRAAVRRALARDPRERPTAAEMRDALAGFSRPGREQTTGPARRLVGAAGSMRSLLAEDEPAASAAPRAVHQSR